MSILDRDSLEQSSLSDLHAIASELTIDSFRRLRKAELIDAILERQSPSGAGEAVEPEEPAMEEEPAVKEGLDEREDGDEDSKPRRRRLRRGRRRERDEPEVAGGEATGEGDEELETPEPLDAPEAREAVEPPGEPAGQPAGGDEVAGVIEVLAGGSGFVRVDPPDPSDDDVYVSAAQVRRFELVSGDQVSGPRRPPRRSERFASLVRVETVNGRSVSELDGRGRFEDLAVAWPSEPLLNGSEDPTLSAVLAAVPLGRGSRVTIAGPAQTGKTELIRRLSAALAGADGLEVQLVLCGIRPEEIADWSRESSKPAVALALGASADTRSQAVEAAIEQARRLAARGAHAVVLIDSLDGLAEGVRNKALGAARQIVDGGSVTLIGTASQPVGGESGVIVLDPGAAAAGRWPALDRARSWTMRPELLVGEGRAAEIAQGRADAVNG